MSKKPQSINDIFNCLRIGLGLETHPTTLSTKRADGTEVTVNYVAEPEQMTLAAGNASLLFRRSAVDAGLVEAIERGDLAKLGDAIKDIPQALRQAEKFLKLSNT